MLTGREMGFEDYVRILRRRLHVIIWPALGCAALGYLITLFIAPEYTSTGLILIESPNVPASLVPAITTSDLFTRLATMEEQIESRSRLQPLIERYDLYKSERKGSMEDAVSDMRKDIEVKAETFEDNKKNGSSTGTLFNGQKQPLPGFSVAFTAESARLAQQVSNELVSMFMTENLRQHEQAAKGTTDFLSSQVAEAKRELDDESARLADFKRRNLGALPSDTQANLQVLASLNTQLAAISDQINRAQQNKAYEQSLVSQQEAAWNASAAAPDNSSLDLMKQQLTKMKDELTLDQTRYTDDYPDVIKLKKDIAELQKQIDAQSASSSTSSSAGTAGQTAQSGATAGPSPKADTKSVAAQSKTPPNPAAAPATPTPGGPTPASIQQLRAALKQDDIFIAGKIKQQDKLQQQMKSYEGRLQTSPTVEEEYNRLTLGHDAALKFYDTLLGSRDSSQMSVNMENQGQGETFVVLDPPDLPQSPSFPVWWQFALGGFAAGLAVGAAVALVFELGDKALRDERDVEYYLGLPTLTLVPSIGAGNGYRKNGQGRFRRRRKRRAIAAARDEAAKAPI
jgi:uncharacterized protein involved in exopolysaccharide biosynthesis